MSDSSSSDPRETASFDGPGILAGLPRTRPQRPSARRAASRTAKSGKRPLTHANRSKPGGESAPGGGPATKPASTRKPAAKPAAARKPTAKPALARKPAAIKPAAARRPVARPVPPRKPAGEPVPVQGYEPESDSPNRPIQPPGGAELVASIAELAGELAKAGAGTGGRMLRDFLSRLPG